MIEGDIWRRKADGGRLRKLAIGEASTVGEHLRLLEIERVQFQIWCEGLKTLPVRHHRQILHKTSSVKQNSSRNANILLVMSLAAIIMEGIR